MLEPSLETVLQNINLKLTVKSINRKSDFKLSFFTTLFRTCYRVLNALDAPIHCYFISQTNNMTQFFKDRIKVSQTQTGQKVDNVVESYSLGSDYH